MSEAHRQAETDQDDMIARLAVVTREIRARQHLSQAEVARRGGLGKHYPGMVERGKANPSITQHTQLAKPLGLSGAEELMNAAAARRPGDDD